MTATYRERTATSGDLRLAYQEWGSDGGPVILALHGFGVSGHMFDEFGQRAADRYRLINLDQRGHGDSEWSPDGDYTREAFVADVEAVREELGLERFILMGHSMGGLNAVEYTFQHPERVSALVLVDVGPEAAKEGVDNIMRFTRGPDELDFDEFVQNAMRFNTRRTEENIRERMRHRLRPLENGKWTWKFDKRFREGEGAVRSGSQLSSDELWRRFRELAPPVLLIRGEQSDILSQEVADRTAGEIRNARLVVVPGAGHSVPGDNPDGFTSAITGFLADLDEGAFPEPDATPIPIPEDIEELRSGWRERDRRFPGVPLIAGIAVGLAAVAATVAFVFSRFRRGRSDEA
ncbi:MAG: alpha/beta hydrolase [Chloroflexi bacterium]|nr:alpha/beta hydrolase [Chloroflexota bacterium]